MDSETYNTGDKDFNAQLTKIAPKNPDVMFLPEYYSTVAVIAKEARSAGIKATFLGGDGWDSSELFSIGGDAVNGVYFSNHYSADDTSKEVVEFIKDYKAKYNELFRTPLPRWTTMRARCCCKASKSRQHGCGRNQECAEEL